MGINCMYFAYFQPTPQFAGEGRILTEETKLAYFRDSVLMLERF